LRICIIGKYPPIQGGVSTRTYLAAHALAQRGHEVHVVTNAKEVVPPFRMHMREADWRHCEPSFRRGSVRVHWSDPVDRSQAHIPMASPFVSKLATLAACVHKERPLDVIYSHYMEPYGVAGYLAAQMTGVPHVVRMAGSDAGRLWHHPQLETLYDHVLRSAATMIAVGKVAERARQCGVDPARIIAAGGDVLPRDVFTPDGPALDFQQLRGEVEASDLRDAAWGNLIPGGPYLGVYGKLGESKGTFALLSAMQRLKLAGIDIGLVALAHGRPEIERQFRAQVEELGLADRVLQIPFLPHWRVPEFLRGCLAVCCLEQDFPIGLHSPIIPLEVMLCGTCLIASTEVIRKLPHWQRPPHGWGWIAIDDVNDIAQLSAALAAMVHEPHLAATVGARGRRLACKLQDDSAFPERLEAILQTAAMRKGQATRSAGGRAPATQQFPLTRLAANALADLRGVDVRAVDASEEDGTLALAHRTLAEIERAAAAGACSMRPLAQAVEIEIAIATAEAGTNPTEHEEPAPLQAGRWALQEEDIAGLIAVRDPRLQILRFAFDAGAFRNVASLRELPVTVGPGPSYLAVFCSGQDRTPFLVDQYTARICELSDGTKTVRQIIRCLERKLPDGQQLNHRAWIEDLVLSGLLRLRPAQ
jgi:glycosyltransferase involved in cell wall biosynthesis